MTELIDTTEMYLRIILELEEERVTPMRARIAERLAHSGPTVSQTIARMERDGLVTVAEDRHLELTAEGRLLATRVMRKHRIAERLLVDILGLELEYVHDEACRWEHVISERVERRLIEILGHPTHSPYGNPIPGLHLLNLNADPNTPGFLDGVMTLIQAAKAQLSNLVVARLGEPVQTDSDLLGHLASAGVRPGARVAARQVGSAVLITVEGTDGEVGIPDVVASHIFVSAA